MSITMSAYVQIADEDIAEAMYDDNDFAVNVFLAVSRRIKPESLKECIEELSDDEQTRLHTFAHELANVIEAPGPQPVRKERSNDEQGVSELPVNVRALIDLAGFYCGDGALHTAADRLRSAADMMAKRAFGANASSAADSKITDEETL